MSLKCMIDKWLHKGQISQEEYDAVIKKLEGHDKQIRADVIEEMTQTIREIEADTTNCLFDCPKADEPISCTICVLERAVEQLKGAENE